METPILHPSELTTYADAVAGHEGVLSDPSGALIIKPCHPAEIAFYEATVAAHPAFAALLPIYMGSLSLSSSLEQQREALRAASDPMSLNAALQAEEGAAEQIVGAAVEEELAQAREYAQERERKREALVAETGETVRMFGRKVDSGRAVVLENVAAGFTRPCVLDVKLGERLWDDAAPEAKRRRLDIVAAETTSKSLGMRVAGMRVWVGEEGRDGDGDAKSEREVRNGYRVFDKMYGRALTEENVDTAFREFFFSSPAGKDGQLAEAVVKCCEDEVARMQEVIEEQESRMYSASILFVYEGDLEAMEKAMEDAQAPERRKTNDRPESGDDDEDDDDDDEEPPKIYAVKLIDFAHAAWTPGHGPDENALQGIRSVKRILSTLSDDTL